MFGEMMKAWGPMNEAGMAMWQQMLGQMGGKAPTLSDTIFALSSGAPPAAIAIVRISGPRADAALEALAGTLPAAAHGDARRACAMTGKSLIMR